MGNISINFKTQIMITTNYFYIWNNTQSSLVFEESNSKYNFNLHIST